MTKTLAVKVLVGLHSQGWQVSGYGGSWAVAMRPLEAYIQKQIERAVRAEREACAKVCDDLMAPPRVGGLENAVLYHDATEDCAAAIRARSKA
jgi:hypothetical protein